MSNFESKFLRILKENPSLDRAAMESQLDDGTDPTDFDIDMTDVGPTDEVADAISRRNQRDLADLQNWIDKTAQFLAFLNGDQPNSIQQRLATAVADTTMDKVKTSQQSKIANIASNLASFHQALLGFKAQGNNPALKDLGQ
jgi:hypothetical protein